MHDQETVSSKLWVKRGNMFKAEMVEEAAYECVRCFISFCWIFSKLHSFQQTFMAPAEFIYENELTCEQALQLTDHRQKFHRIEFSIRRGSNGAINHQIKSFHKSLQQDAAEMKENDEPQRTEANQTESDNSDSDEDNIDDLTPNAN